MSRIGQLLSVVTPPAIQSELPSDLVERPCKYAPEHLCTYKSSAACGPVRFGAEAPWRRAAGAVADPSVVGDAAAGTSGRSEPRRCRKLPCAFLTESFTLDVALRTSSSTLAESAVENERMRSSALYGRNGSEAAPAHASGANTCVRAC